ILVDDYISYILQTMSEGSQIITADQFNDFVDHMLKSGPENYAATMGIAQESASLLLPSAILVRRILKATKAEQIWAPGVSLADGIAYEYGEKEKIIKNRHDFENDIVACAVNMSKRYQGDAQRNKLLEDVAVSLFDQTKKIHGCGKRERLLLRIAALLNDCGRFVSLEASAECGYSIIMATEMIGLSHAEREIVANMVRFNKTNFDYSANMGKESYLKIAKLTAIFRVADGICRSYRTKVKDVKFAIREDELLITVDADDEITLEKGFFGRKASMFEEVFGIRPVLRQKKAAV
ncbi:MAG: exopolyphosphatase, partial [Lachnospiraceae bacterium]|nr:exopolyphosphatase [Lachnospiraceae bacterium]